MAFKMLSPYQQCQHYILEMQFLRIYSKSTESKTVGVNPATYALASHPGDSDGHKSLRITVLHSCTQNKIYIFFLQSTRHILHGLLLCLRPHLCYLLLAHFTFFLCLNIPSNCGLKCLHSMFHLPRMFLIGLAIFIIIAAFQKSFFRSLTTMRYSRST